MSLTIPLAVARYLRNLDCRDTSVLAFMELDENLCVSTSGGDLSLLLSGALEYTSPVTSQISILQGVIPSGPEPVVIENAHLIDGVFFDLHLFTVHGLQWVVVLDRTHTARSLQTAQQRRLDNDILLEQASTTGKK